MSIWDEISKLGKTVALKFELQTHSLRLSHEHSIYKALSGMSGIPTMHWYGREVPYNVMVLDRLDLTLEEVISKHHDINLVFSYADQMLSCLESLHERSYIHRDVKPTNFMTGAGELSSRVFLIDFGLAQLFRNPSTQSTCSAGFWAQDHRHHHLYLNQQPFRMDTNIVMGSIEKYAASVLEKKIALSKTLCQGLPAPFVAFTQHIQSLGFDERPQYDKLHTLLMQCLARDSNGVVSNPITVSPLPGKPGNSLPRSGRIMTVNGTRRFGWVSPKKHLLRHQLNVCFPPPWHHYQQTTDSSITPSHSSPNLEPGSSTPPLPLLPRSLIIHISKVSPPSPKSQHGYNPPRQTATKLLCEHAQSISFTSLGTCRCGPISDYPDHEYRTDRVWCVEKRQDLFDLPPAHAVIHTVALSAAAPHARQLQAAPRARIPDFSFSTMRRKALALDPSDLLGEPRMLDMSLKSGNLEMTLESDYQKIFHLCVTFQGTEVVAVGPVSTIPKLVSYGSRFLANLDCTEDISPLSGTIGRRCPLMWPVLDRLLRLSFTVSGTEVVTQISTHSEKLSANAMLQTAWTRLREKEDSLSYVVQQRMQFSLGSLRLVVFPQDDGG
ncbi:kinase-like domain-containing protein [Lactarius sanguifluus]|nr:kinase-like domain-containing protein [Lactarius sanguifluus]